jgi:hypothetical protein
MQPHLVRWDKEYRQKGLVVIEVDNGEIDAREDVARHVAELDLSYPVLWDEGQKTCLAYGVHRYSTAYLIGVDGKVLWEGDPTKVLWEGDKAVLDRKKMAENEERVREALEKVDLDALRKKKDPFVTGPAEESQ